MQVTPETMNDSISAGPVRSCAATPVRTKMPVPMIAPTPRLESCTGPSTRRRRFFAVEFFEENAVRLPHEQLTRHVWFICPCGVCVRNLEPEPPG